MINISSISKLPNVPAIYAMYGGKRSKYIAYVGMADKLKRRIEQHLINRDSSVTTGTSATGLNPDHVTELRWWENPKFSNRNFLHASELVAFDLFQPTLRSRGNIPKVVLEIYILYFIRRIYESEFSHFLTRKVPQRSDNWRAIAEEWENSEVKS